MSDLSPIDVYVASNARGIMLTAITPKGSKALRLLMQMDESLAACNEAALLLDANKIDSAFDLLDSMEVETMTLG